MNENISITDISSQEIPSQGVKSSQEIQSQVVIEEALKYTCLTCDYKTKTRTHMEKHVESTHEVTDKEVNVVCGLCDHEFKEKESYNLHVRIHDEHETEMPMIKAITYETIDNTEDLTGDHGDEANVAISSAE